MYPDLGVDVFVNGEPMSKFMSSFDGTHWRLIFLNLPEDVTVEIRKRGKVAVVEAEKLGEQTG